MGHCPDRAMLRVLSAHVGPTSSKGPRLRLWFRRCSKSAQALEVFA
jgi:hypothetical protein